jgi:hypothetical protein
MKAPVAKAIKGPVSDDQELVADLFHALSQPLTSLRCSLEVTLFEPRAAAQYQQALRESLTLSEQITELVVGIRELLEADEPPDVDPPIPLSPCLEEIVADLLPVAEYEGKNLTMSTAPGCVCIAAHRLKQALLSLLQCALDGCARGATVTAKIENAEKNGAMVLQVVTPGMQAGSCIGAVRDGRPGKMAELRRRLRLAIARRIFEAAGGRFQLKERAMEWRCEVRLQRAGQSAGAAKFSHSRPVFKTGKDLPR